MDFKTSLKLIKKEVFSAFKNNKYLLLISILLFFIPLICGYLYADSINSYMQPMIKSFEQNIESGKVTLSTFSLFTNNFKVSIIIYAFSAIGGLLGAFILANNALFIGYFGFNFHLADYLLLILPHGIFEIPSIIISATAGFVLLSFIIHFLWNLISPDYSYVDVFDPYFSDFKITIKQRILSSFNKHQNKLKESLILFSVSVVLLLIAAFIEANITLPFAKFILSLFAIV